jgi:hypothetical protein
MNIPKHIAIIMDGNGRWAKKHNLPRIVGHKKGVDAVRTIVKYCGTIGVQTLVSPELFANNVCASVAISCTSAGNSVSSPIILSRTLCLLSLFTSFLSTVKNNLNGKILTIFVAKK